MPISTEIKEARVRSNPMVNNLLINPGFEIWQRGAGPFTAGQVFTADEWRNDKSAGASLSVSRSSSPLFGDYCLSFDLSNPTDGYDENISQSLESYTCLEGKWVTFSVWINCSLESCVRLRLGDRTTDSDLTYSAYHTGGGSWERLTVAKLIRESLQTNVNWEHSFGLRASVIATRDVSNVLIDGAVLAEGYFPEGVPFVPPNPAEDLERCQRFYQRSSSDPQDGSIFRQDVVSGSNYFADHFFQTPMYATPTLTITNGNNVGFGASPAGTNVDRKGFKEWRTATATAASRYFWSYWEAEVS